MWHEQKILLIPLGNTVESLRSRIETVRSRFPKSEIAVLCAAEWSQSLRLDVHQVLVHDAIAQSELSDVPERLLNLIELLKAEQFDAAIILPHEQRSPYPMAYLCYFAEIPVRIGMSCEFGGGVLSQCVEGVTEWLHNVQEVA